MFAVEYFQHRRQCKFKQAQRENRIKNLPAAYKGRPSVREIDQILTRPLEELISDVQNQRLSPLAVLQAFSKAAIMAHERTNCLTEIMTEEMIKKIEAKQITFTPSTSGDGKPKPLAGLPVSLKDTILVGGFDTTVGFSSRAGKWAEQDGPMVRLLKDAGAIPFVKTNVPTTLLSFESSNDVWGRTVNPHNRDYSPGGSTGGEAALLALNGSRVGIGSDVAGSVRLPAAWSGCAALRCSTGRWPRSGTASSMPGQEGVPSVFSPMARTVADLHILVRGVMKMKPWEYDYSVHPIPWDDGKVKRADLDAKLRIGVMRSDDVVDPTPACARALEETVSLLKAEGHELFDIEFTPHTSPQYGLVLAAALLNSDGCETFGKTLRFGETNDPGAARMLLWARLPRFFRWVWYLWVKYVCRDELWAEVLKQFHGRTSEQLWTLVARREAYRSDWHTWWDRQASGGGAGRKMDVILTVPNATPALPHGAMRDAFAACGYTFLWNMLDYSSGVVPVSKVDPAKDDLPCPSTDSSATPPNSISRAVHRYYNPAKMANLPLGVQIVARRWEEETVLGVMRRIERLMKYKGIRVWELADEEDREKEKMERLAAREAKGKGAKGNVRFEGGREGDEQPQGKGAGAVGAKVVPVITTSAGTTATVHSSHAAAAFSAATAAPTTTTLSTPTTSASGLVGNSPSTTSAPSSATSLLTPVSTSSAGASSVSGVSERSERSDKSEKESKSHHHHRSDRHKDDKKDKKDKDKDKEREKKDKARKKSKGL